MRAISNAPCKRLDGPMMAQIMQLVEYDAGVVDSFLIEAGELIDGGG